MTIAAFVPDLMDRSRFGNADVVFVANATDAIQSNAELVLVDLDRCDEPAEFRLVGTTVIGFGSHVDLESAAAARAAGFDEVLARSVFFRRLPQIVESR